MAMNKDDLDKAIAYLSSNLKRDFEKFISSGINQTEYYAYSSSRPYWVGFYNSLAANNIEIHEATDFKHPQVVCCKQPIPYALVRELEINAANNKALDSLADEITKDSNLVLFNSETNSCRVLWRFGSSTEAVEIKINDGNHQLKTLEKGTNSLSPMLLIAVEEGYKRRLPLSPRLENSLGEDVTAALYFSGFLNETGMDIKQDITPETLDLYTLQISAFTSSVFEKHPRFAEKMIKYWQSTVNALVLDKSAYKFPYELMNSIGERALDIVENRKEALAASLNSNESSADSELIKWPDLDSLGIYLGEQRFSDGVDRLMLVDLHDYIKKENLSSFTNTGFKPIPNNLRLDGGIYYLAKEEQVIRPSVLASALGLDKLPFKNIERDAVPQLFKDKIFERFEININRYALDSELLGINSKGDRVFDSPYGRFHRNSASNVTVESRNNSAGLKSSAFLRADSLEDLADCCDAFVSLAATGKRLNFNDFRKFANIIYDVPEATAFQLHRLQEGVEASSYRIYADRASSLNDQEAYILAQNIYFGLPAARMRTGESIALEQYSTPIPIGLVCQRLLIGNDAIPEGATVLEPTGGNGGLLGRLPAGLQKQIVELDEKRVLALRHAFPDATILQDDATRLNFNKVFGNETGSDYLIANPPFGQMAQPLSFDLLPKVRRLDHYIALRALASRKDSGRAVVILGADSNMSDGTVKGSAKNVLTYLNDCYEILGAVEIDGRLYARAGAAYNVRVLVIGDKHPRPVQKPQIEKLPVLDSFKDLWDWSESVISSYGKNIVSEATTSFDDIIKAQPEPLPVTALAPSSEPVQPPKSPVNIEPGNEVTEVVDEVVPAEKITSPKKEVIRNINEFQAPYQPASRSGEPSTMIPINMSAAAYKALQNVVERYGDVDSYVADRLHYTKEELPLYFSAEQVDALALGIARVEDDMGMINADQTGIGKGRFVAGMLRYARLNNKLPVFLSIKPELFTDIFRDITDINSQHLFKKPFIFNDDVNIKVYGTADQILYQATPANERKEAMAAEQLPEDVDIVMATYSQFARARSKNKKSALLLNIVNDNSMMLLDESHVAAGESQTSEIISDCVGKAGGVIYASATPIKGVKNFRLYSKCFPPSVDTVNLAEVLAVGGEDLQEAISTNMSLDGAIIRREHDFSKLTFDTRHPEKGTVDRNREMMDYVASILGEMSFLSGDVEKRVNLFNKTEEEEWSNVPEAVRKGNRMNASSMNFSSRLYNITRQFLLAVKTDEAIQACLEAINNGQKPVVAVENTGEALLRTLISIRSGADVLEEELQAIENAGNLSADDEARRSALQDKISEVTRGVIFEAPPQFKDLLEVMLDRIGKITVRGRYGEVDTMRADDDPEYFDKQESLREKIQDFPFSLSLTPIDEIRHSMARHGYRFSEVSGRTVSLVPRTIDGRDAWGVSYHKKADAVSVVAGFQNGTFDGVIITRSGSTGISLHATNRFKDSDARQRNFIVLQKAANIAEFLQWMGRVNRKDQVVSPVITNIESGLPAEARQTMMHNSKLRKLSANTTSNRENENLEGDEDLLNSVGDKVALQYLYENPDIADSLDIKLPAKGEEMSHMSENPYINKLMGRLMMIPVKQQESILTNISDRYVETIEQMEQQGKNPFKIDAYDWKAKIISSEELVSGNLNETDSSFDEPVKLVRIEYKKFIEPIRYSQLERLMERNINIIYKNEDGVVDMDQRLNDFKNSLALMQRGYVVNHLPRSLIKQSPSLEAIRSIEKGIDGAKTALIKSDYLLNTITSLKIGRQVEMMDKDTDKNVYGVIAEIQFPSDNKDVFTLSKYRIKLAIPGKDELIEKSLAALRGMDAVFKNSFPDLVPGKSIDDYLPMLRAKVRNSIQAFDIAPRGELTIQRNLLEGNIYRACEMAATESVGHPILYTDETGNRKRAVNVKASLSVDQIRSLPVGFNAKDAMKYILEYRANSSIPNLSSKVQLFSVNQRDMEEDEGIKITVHRRNDFAIVQVKGTKFANNALISNGHIFDLGEKTEPGSMGVQLSGNRTTMKCEVDIQNLGEFLSRLETGHHLGKFYVPNPNPDILNELKMQNQSERENKKNNGGYEMKMTG